MIITGTVPTSSPLHITDGSRNAFDPETGREASNITATQRQVVNTPEGRKYVPCMNAGTFRGRIRAAATSLVVDAVLQHNAQMSVPLYNAIRHGDTGGSITRSEIDPRDVIAVQNNPFFSLFGGGPRMLAAGVTIKALYAASAEYFASAVSGNSEPPENARPSNSYINIERSYSSWDLRKRPSKKTVDVINDYDNAMDELLIGEAKDRDKKRKKENAAPSENDSNNSVRTSNILGHETIIAGTPMVFSLRLQKHLTPVAKGFFLTALAKALNEGNFGGIVRNDYGNFDLKSAAANLKAGGDPVFGYDDNTGELHPVGAGEEFELAYLEWVQNGQSWINEDLWAAAGFSGDHMFVNAAKNAA